MQVKYEDILRIYEDEVRKNTKNKKKIYRFERYKIENLTEICDILESNSYKYMRYNIFLIRRPKYRVVMSLSIKDKIINHYVTRFILMPKLERYLDMRNVDKIYPYHEVVEVRYTWSLDLSSYRKGYIYD